MCVDSCRRKMGFTLAEILITLGIVGVIAAVTVPTIIQSYINRSLQVALKKEYSVIQEAFGMYQARNYGSRIKPSQIGSQELKSLIMEFFGVIKDCGFGSNYNTTLEKPCVKNSEIIYKTLDGKNASMGYFDDGQFILKDGSMVFLENVIAGRVYISVDVNGYIKGPNIWGVDLFTFQLMSDGRILPMGAEGTDYADETSYCSRRLNSSYTNGIACTEKALKDKNYFSDLN